MISTRIIRCFSTRSIVDKWFNALQSKTHEEQQQKLGQCIEYSLEHQHEQSNHSNVVTSIIQRLAIEQPKTEALWTYENNEDTCQKLTFSDVYTQSSHLADMLIGNRFNLTTGKTVLIILPSATKESILMQLACLQNHLVVYSYDPKHITEQDIRQRIRTLAIDGIITNVDYIEMIMNCTCNSLRPLKKGIIGSHTGPLPVGWHDLMEGINDSYEKRQAEKEFAESEKRVLRHLLIDTPMNPYFESRFSLRQMLIGYWLNMNKLPRLIWIKDYTYKITLASWLLGSTVFYKKTDDLKTICETLEKNPIDTFCASKDDYQLLNQQQSINTNLQQLYATQPITDPTVRSHWQSITNLPIYDNSVVLSTDLSNTSKIELLLKTFINPSEYKKHEDIYQNDLIQQKCKMYPCGRKVTQGKMCFCENFTVN